MASSTNTFSDLKQIIRQASFSVNELDFTNGTAEDYAKFRTQRQFKDLYRQLAGLQELPQISEGALSAEFEGENYWGFTDDVVTVATDELVSITVNSEVIPIGEKLTEETPISEAIEAELTVRKIPFSKVLYSFTPALAHGEKSMIFILVIGITTRIDRISYQKSGTPTFLSTYRITQAAVPTTYTTVAGVMGYVETDVAKPLKVRGITFPAPIGALTLASPILANSGLIDALLKALIREQGIVVKNVTLGYEIGAASGDNSAVSCIVSGITTAPLSLQLRKNNVTDFDLTLS